MNSIRDQFVRDFSEQTALAIEAAAEQHENGLHPDKGSDPFKWSLMLVISYQCITKYRAAHGIKPSAKRLTAWIKDHADMSSYDGDVDMLALLAGAYDPYVKVNQENNNGK